MKYICLFTLAAYLMLTNSVMIVMKFTVLQIFCISYLIPWVSSVVHDSGPALEDGHLEEGQVRDQDVVEVDVAVDPGHVVGEAGLQVGDDDRVRDVTHLIHALTKQTTQIERGEKEKHLIT